MEQLQLTYLKDVYTGEEKPFITKEGSIGKEFAVLKLQEYLVQSGKYTPAEKTHIINQLRINRYLTLLSEGYDKNMLNSLIDSAVIGLKTAAAPVDDLISELEAERRLVNSANEIYTYGSNIQGKKI